MTGEYTNPLCSRYASDLMKKIFSEEEKISSWRNLWTSLAAVEKAYGANVTDEQISEMKQHIINDAKTNVGKCPSIVSKYVRKVKLKIAGLPSAKPSRVEV